MRDVGLLARAIAGRALAIAVDDDRPPSTDGATLWVPSDAASRSVTPIVVQAGVVASGGLHPRLVSRLVGRRDAAARYLALEALRLLVELRDVLPPAVERELRALGDVRIPASAEESLSRALAKERVDADPWTIGVLRPSAVLRARATGASDPAEDELSRQRLDRLRDFTDQDIGDPDDADTEARDRLTAPLGKNPLSRLLRDLMDASFGAAASDDDGAAEIAVAGARAVREGGGGRISTHAGIALGDEDRDVAGSVYPEWDCRRERYKPAHCVVHHMDPAPPDVAESLRLDPDPALQRTLARLGLALERHGRLADGEGLDLRALVDFGVARAAGEHVDPRVYETRRPTAHDLGVLVLLDASGSTAERKAAGDRIWDEQRRLAGALVHALEQVGDRVAAYGFRSYGRTDVRFLRIKHFDDRFDRPAQQRLTDLQPAGYTRLGAALRHGRVVTRQAAGTNRQLLLLVSDGLPYEEGYQRRYAEEDSRRALDEAVSDGVACVCLSVGSSQDPEALERVWGAVNHLHVSGARDVAPHAEHLIRSALTAALGASHGLATMPTTAGSTT